MAGRRDSRFVDQVLELQDRLAQVCENQERMDTALAELRQSNEQIMTLLLALRQEPRPDQGNGGPNPPPPQQEVKEDTEKLIERSLVKWAEILLCDNLILTITTPQRLVKHCFARTEGLRDVARTDAVQQKAAKKLATKRSSFKKKCSLFFYDFYDFFSSSD